LFAAWLPAASRSPPHSSALPRSGASSSPASTVRYSPLAEEEEEGEDAKDEVASRELKTYFF
jgi:hypothetical protein